MNTIHLPFLSSGKAVAEPAHDGPYAIAPERLCDQWRSLRPQGRAQMVNDPTLMAYAAWCAADAVAHNTWGHIRSTGEGANDAARRFGVWLPDFYGTGPEANNIESLSFNIKDPLQCLPRLLTSPGHKAHLLAEYDTYVQQVRIGAAFAFNDPALQGHWWTVACFISTPAQPEG